METIDISRKQVWTAEQVLVLFDKPFMDLGYQAQNTHRQFHPVSAVQLSTLLSIKTGGCPEDCSYCSQSSRYQTHVEREKIMAGEEVVAAAKQAKAQGATRFCMGAAWRGPKQLKAAGLDYYNHNIDTAPYFYQQIISTRTYQDRIDTLERVKAAGINVCCGGIIGLGESRKHRAGLLAALANMNPPPQSVPINHLVKIPGTPLADEEDLDPFEFIRTIAVARILMPASQVRLSAGRETMDDSTQALCFMAGANSIFYGDCLLTTANPQREKDEALFKRLNLYSSHQHQPSIS